jgi:hypothetical protein
MYKLRVWLVRLVRAGWLENSNSLKCYVSPVVFSGSGSVCISISLPTVRREFIEP